MYVSKVVSNLYMYFDGAAPYNLKEVYEIVFSTIKSQWKVKKMNSIL